jgi:hypothetical protein
MGQFRPGLNHPKANQTKSLKWSGPRSAEGTGFRISFEFESIPTSPVAKHGTRASFQDDTPLIHTDHFRQLDFSFRFRDRLVQTGTKLAHPFPFPTFPRLLKR